MSTRFLSSTLAILLTVAIVAPSAFFIAPQRVRAVPVTVVGDIVGWVQQTITAVATPISAAAETAQWVNTNVLQPLAFVLSGKLMKLLTSGVIAFVIGKANSTGVPQFVVDVQKSYQTVADGQALAYLSQIGNTNSPFSYSIASALRTDYLSKSSLKGFWDANMNNLAATSPNVNAYLGGNWSQGGVAAWFALTTQVQNNPYTFYPKVQSQLANVIGPGVGGATGARDKQLSWGQGFMSWCTTDSTVPETAPTTSREEIVACQTQHPTWDDVKCMEYVAQNRSYDASTAPTSIVGANPGDPCTNKDGTSGKIQTPGSTIKATLDKVLGGQQDQIVRMGNVGPQINKILGDIGTIMNTVQFASDILGGPSGGLLGSSNTSSSNTSSRLSQFANSSAFGLTGANIYQNAANDPLLNGSLMTNQIARYQTAWNTIATSANIASTSVVSLMNYCQAQIGVAQLQLQSSPNDPVLQTFMATASGTVVSAATALTTEIAPVFDQIATSSLNIASATMMVQKVKADLNSPEGSASTAYATDLQMLQSMSPTATDVADAQQNAQSSGMAVATPAGSLTIATTSPASIVDKMYLISNNAQAKMSSCTAPVSGN